MPREDLMIAIEKLQAAYDATSNPALGRTLSMARGFGRFRGATHKLRKSNSMSARLKVTSSLFGEGFEVERALGLTGSREDRKRITDSIRNTGNLPALERDALQRVAAARFRQSGMGDAAGAAARNLIGSLPQILDGLTDEEMQDDKIMRTAIEKLGSGAAAERRPGQGGGKKL